MPGNGLARAGLRARPASYLGTFIALLFAAAVVSGCGLMLQAGIQAHVPPQRYTHTPLVVAAKPTVSLHTGHGDNADTETEALAGTPRLPATDLRAIAHTSGVAAALPDVSFPTPELTVSGASSHRITHPTGTAPHPGHGQLVLDQAAARATHSHPGSRLTLDTPAGRRTFTVTGVLAENGPAVGYVSDTDAPRLAGHPGRLDAVAVLPRAGTDLPKLKHRLHQRFPDASVLTGNHRGDAEQPRIADAREALTAIGGSFGGVATLVAVFVVITTTALATAQRGRDFALLRAIGATGRQVKRAVLTENGLIALAAGTLGCLPGFALAHYWFDGLRDRGVIPDGVTLHAGWLVPLIAVAAVLLAAVLGSLASARRVARIRPTEALRESTVRRRWLSFGSVLRLVLGLCAVAGAGVLGVVAANQAGDSAAGTAVGIVALATVALGLLGPQLGHIAALAMKALLRPFGAAGYLAGAGAKARARRIATAIVPVAMAVAFGGTLITLGTTGDHQATVQARQAVTADRVLTAPGGVTPALRGAAARTPGVRQATAISTGSVLVRAGSSLDGAAAQGITGPLKDLPNVLDIGLATGHAASWHAASRHDDGTVAMSTVLAASAHAHLGQPVQLWLPDGTHITPRLVATYTRGAGTAGITLPRATLISHLPVALDTRVLVRLAPHASARLRALADVSPGLTVTNRSGYTAGQVADQAASDWMNRMMVAVLGGFALIASLTTIAMTTAERRPEFALLRLAGATRRQLRGMLAGEGLLAGGIAVICGVAAGYAGLRPMLHGLYGVDTPWAPGWFWAVLIALGPLVSLSALRRWRGAPRL